MAMTAPYRTLLAPGLVLILFGAGYIFVPRPDAAPSATSAPRAVAVTATTMPAAPIVTAVPAAPTAAAMTAAPTAKPSGMLAPARAPVPLVPRTHDTYYAPKQPDAAVQTVSATTAPGGAGTDGALPPPSDETKAGGDSEAKAAIELDGYKNVRALVKGPDGLWRGRAMRGRTEITVRVDATGNVSAE